MFLIRQINQENTPDIDRWSKAVSLASFLIFNFYVVFWKKVNEIFLKRCYVYIPFESLWRWWQVFDLHGRLYLEMRIGPDGSKTSITILVSSYSMIAVGEEGMFLEGVCQGSPYCGHHLIFVNKLMEHRQPCPFTYILSMVTFGLQWQCWILLTQSRKYLPSGSISKMLANIWFRLFISYQIAFSMHTNHRETKFLLMNC